MKHFLLPAIALALSTFLVFRCIYLCNARKAVRASLIVTALLLATPAALFASNYLILVPFERWFVEFHSIPGIETTSGLVGALLGVMFASARIRPHWLNTPILTLATCTAVMLLVAPFGKQLLCHQDYTRLENRWKGGVCQQTSGSTCVPASCATIVKMLGGDVTERQIAERAGTNSRGTEVWYLKRAMRGYGYNVEVRSSRSALRDAPVPCILGVMLGDVGHAVVLMSKNPTGPEIGDPAGTRRSYTWKAFERKYRPKPMYLVIKPMSRR